MKLKGLFRLLTVLIIVAYGLTMTVAFNKYPSEAQQAPLTLELNPDQQEVNLSGLKDAYEVTVRLIDIITNLTR